MSKTRKRYWIRLVGRCLIFIIGIIMCFISPEKFEVLDGMNFFKSFSEFHLLWICWIVDMVLQIIPIKNEVPLGSQKLFANRFRPIREKINYEVLRKYVVSTTMAAYFIIMESLIR